ncbi:hypothetical protein [Parasitella parasitica]|uniref:rRNA biogenesis protein RRP36 n=1 Tax=Parasitella parasitica TaxID=35722 RepID=A0A0B7MWI8_9FUNG|nr:hypothetical protein [Parasitella parasitica]
MAISKKQQVYEYESDQEKLYSDTNSDQEEDDERLEQNKEESDEEESDEESDEEEYKALQLAKIKRDLAHVSFEQLADLKAKMGDNESVKQEKKKISRDQILKDLKGAAGKLKKDSRVKLLKQDMKRENKNRPMEISSKRAVGRHRNVVQLQAEKRRDPRFDRLSGQLNQDLFEKSYNFLNDYKKSEMEILKESIKKEQDEEKQEHMKGLLLKMVSSDKQEQEKKRKQALLRERKKQEAELVKQGKTPYFLKRSEKRKLDLMDRYEKLGTKSVDRILEKRRKRNTTKDRKHLPFNKRRSAAE